MKKFLMAILCLLILFGCSKEKQIVPDFSSGFELDTFDPNMTYYEGIGKGEHCFRQIRVSELFRTVDEKGYGVFVLGYVNCPWCQATMAHLNEVGLELGVEIYYIDAKSEEYPLSKEDFANLKKYLEPILMEDEEGVKSLYTPHVFSIIDGQFVNSQISITGNDNYDLENPSDEDVKWLKDIYREILKPFVH